MNRHNITINASSQHPMNSPLTNLANGFYVLAALLGAPSLLMIGFYGSFRLNRWMGPAHSTFQSPPNSDGVLVILSAIARTVGAGVKVLVFLECAAFGALATVASIMLLLAALFFVTGRGLHGHQNWARLVAGALMAACFGLACLAATTIRGRCLLVLLAVVAGSACGLWAVWRGFTA